MPKAKTNTGFTLIELLVVISIIGLLASLILVSVAESRQRARDSKRVADMNQMAKAMELFFNERFSYPTSAAGGPLNVSMANILVPKFVLTLPIAPQPPDGSCAASGLGSNAYYFSPTGGASTANNYLITFCLGTGSGSLGAGPHTLTQGGLQ